MRMFENKLEDNIDVGYKSRVIASYINEGGKIHSEKFDEYLEKLVELGWIKSKDMYDIKTFATNGKLELEIIANKIIKGEEVK